MITIPIEHLVKLKIQKLNRQREYNIVRIIDHVKIDESTDFIMYVGMPILSIHSKQEEINFFDDNVIYDFGNITEKELIEKYPEYLI